MTELDERYSVAEEAICGAFLLLMRDREPEKITVSDVIKRAGVARSTFYKHYENIPALLNAVEDRTIRELFALMESFHPQDDRELCRSFFLSICRYTRENPFLAGILRSPRGDSFLEKAMTMFHRYVTDVARERPRERGEEVSFMIACAIGSTLGVLHKWTAESFSTDPMTVAELLTRNFITGVLPFLR